MRTIRTNRSILTYIIFSALTCGIYALWFQYHLVKDVNEMLAADGKRTNNILALYLLTLVTCGIYSYIWYYSLGERLGENARQRNLAININGATVLLWILLGSMLCGIGPFVALHKIFEATNRLAEYHNAMIAQNA